MADNNSPVEPTIRKDSHHHAEKYGNKLVDKTQKYEQKVYNATGQDAGEKKGPAGGYDATPIPEGPAGYTVRITFHRAENLPFADVPTFSSDPYIMAILQTDLMKRHKQDSDITFRTPTIHRDTNPTWNSVWTIAHVPASGFHMKCRIFDEDPADHDDRLGNVHVDVPRFSDDWQGFKERKFEVKKRMGSKRAYTFRSCAALLSRSVQFTGSVFISVEVLGKSEGDGGRAYTISPLPWSQHYSPLIGLIAGTKDKAQGKNGKRSTEKYNFQAIQMQLQGPVPERLYHRYVEFKPFVAGMFTSHTLRGRILNHALHHQHARIYNFDGSTKYGQFEEPSIEMTKKFLDFVRYDQGGRIFTYVITLDGQMRFTETGKEFGIDMLSKHTMHSDVSIYIAFSGEFFIRRLKHPHKDKNASPDPATEVLPPADDKADEMEKNKQSERPPPRHEHHDSLAPPPDHHASGQNPSSGAPSNSRRHSFSSWRRRSHSASSSTYSPAPHADATHEGRDPSEDPAHYELIIDNDSGTYRPNAKYLGQLKKFLQRNFPGLKIATLDCQKDEEKMSKLKSEQRERKKKSGKQIMYMQNTSMSSISSSEEEELERRAEKEEVSAGTGGRVKNQWNKVKQLGKHETGENSTNAEKDASDLSSQGKPREKQHSTSTGEKASFDTATEHGDGHFVTPKPSLGNGGLKVFDQDDRPLSKGIDSELEKRGLGRLSQDEKRTIPDESVSGFESNSGSGGVHHAVTRGAL